MHSLTAKISTLQRRLVLRQRIVAVCWTVATVVFAALVLGLADYLLRFTDRGLRLMATAALVAVAVWAAYRWWYRPRARRLAPLGVARQIETRFPQLRDVLASAVEFLQQSEEDASAGSAQLRRLVVAEAETAIEDLPLETVIDRRPLRRAAIYGTAALIALLVCLAFDAGAVGTALARLVNPVGTTEWPRTHYLEFKDSPARLAVGQTFDAVLLDKSGALPEDVQIRYRISDHGKRQLLAEPMMRVGETMVARRENVQQSFSFRAEGGDDHGMPWIDVEVVEPPHVEAFTITTHPPAYTGLPAKAAERYLEAIAGSQIEVAGTASDALAAARIRLDSGETIEAEVRSTDASATDRRGFDVPPEKWMAATSGTYELELENAQGVAGAVASGRLRVVPDSPPSVDWRRPVEDLFVTKSAVVPLQVVVRDDLAIRSVELLYERNDVAASEVDADNMPAPMQRGNHLDLYAGPEEAATAEGETRTIDHELPLGPLGLSPGSQLTMRAEASDYRPGKGQTASQRRVTIITIEQLDARLAEQQAQIVRRLEQALALQRATRAEVERIVVAQRDLGALSAADRNALQTAELNQRRVRQSLSDAGEGVPALVATLLGELEMNRVGSPDVERTMHALQTKLKDLADGPLSAVDRELTMARKTAERAGQFIPATDENPLDVPRAPEDRAPEEEEQSQPAAPAGQPGRDETSRSLSGAAAAQDEVITAVERLVVELSDKADYGRIVRELSQLRSDQIAHEQSTRGEIGLATLPLALDELTREQRATLNKAASGEDAIARRFEKIQQSMDRRAVDLDLQNATASNTLKDAAALARRLAIAADMRDAAGDLAENRVGRALERETQVAAGLEQVLEVLRNRGPQGEQKLDDMRQAEQDLAALRQQLTALRDEAAKMESQGNRGAGDRERLGKRQEELRREAERLARQLERVDANDAGQSTQGAADRLNNRPPGADQNAPPQPGTQDELKQAEQKLEDAARQLGERRAQEELNLALEFINRFRSELAEMIKRQKAVIEGTSTIDATRRAAGKLANTSAKDLENLAAEEKELAGLATEHKELLSGLAAVRISLEEAERRLVAAGELLGKAESGEAVQQAERHALARLEGMMNAFAQTADEAQKKPPAQNPPPPPPPQGQQPQRRPAFELLEVKMLRMLQVELNQRTEAHQGRLAAANGRLSEAEQAAIDHEAQDLAAQQRQLAELAEELLTRNNKKDDK